MASGTRGSSVPRFGTTGRATSLQHVLKNVLECDLTLPLYLSVLQHFGGDEDKFNVIDYFLCDQMYFENLSYSETVIENPKEKDPAKVSCMHRQICEQSFCQICVFAYTPISTINF
jgi:hypothetical protein